MIESIGWALLAHFFILNEVLALTLIIRKFLKNCSWPLGLAVATLIFTQLQFLLVLLEKNSPQLALFLVVLALITNIILLGLRGLPVQKVNLFFSTLAWQRSWPWLLLPVLWIITHFIDACMVHPDLSGEVIGLASAQQWATQGLFHSWQSTSIDQVLRVFSTSFDAISFHTYLLHSLVSKTPKLLALRTQISAQLFHFSLGSVLTMALVYQLIAAFLKEHTGQKHWHQFGLAKSLAWLALAVPLVAQSNVLANHSLIYLLVFFTTILAAVENHFGLSFFALAMLLNFPLNKTNLIAMALGLIAIGFNLGQPPQRIKTIFKQLSLALVFVPLALLSTVIKNHHLTGHWFFSNNTLLAQGWLSPEILNLFIVNKIRLNWNSYLLLALGLGSLSYFLIKRRFIIGNQAIKTLLLLAPLSFLLDGLLLQRLEKISVILLFSIAGLGLIPWLWNWHLRYKIGYAWFFLTLFCVKIPLHVFWQYSPFLLKSSDWFLEQNHKNYGLKQWINLHLNDQAKLIWTDEVNFYYLQPASTSLKEAYYLQQYLRQLATAQNRASALCELGYNFLVWEERHHGPEVAGLSVWFKLNKNKQLFSSKEITIYDLQCQPSNSTAYN